MLDGHLPEIQNIWEVEHGSAAHSSDGHDELFSFGEDHEVIGVVGLGLRRELDLEGDLHAWSNPARHVVDVVCICEALACRLFLSLQLLAFLACLNLEQF